MDRELFAELVLGLPDWAQRLIPTPTSHEPAPTSHEPVAAAAAAALTAAMPARSMRGQQKNVSLSLPSIDSASLRARGAREPSYRENSPGHDLALSLWSLAALGLRPGSRYWWIPILQVKRNAQSASSPSPSQITKFSPSSCISFPSFFSSTPTPTLLSN